jgi:hypothetical protein
MGRAGDVDVVVGQLYAFLPPGSSGIAFALGPLCRSAAAKSSAPSLIRHSHTDRPTAKEADFGHERWEMIVA